MFGDSSSLAKDFCGRVVKVTYWWSLAYYYCRFWALSGLDSFKRWSFPANLQKVGGSTQMFACNWNNAWRTTCCLPPPWKQDITMTLLSLTLNLNTPTYQFITPVYQNIGNCTELFTWQKRFIVPGWFFGRFKEKYLSK